MYSAAVPLVLCVVGLGFLMCLVFLIQCRASGELRRSQGNLLPLNGQHWKQTGLEAAWSFLTCKAASES